MNDRFAETYDVEQYSRLFTYKNESDIGGGKMRIENTHKRMQQGETKQEGTKTEEQHDKRHNRETQRKKKQIEEDTEKEQGT